jgi:hypothetical protein
MSLIILVKNLNSQLAGQAGVPRNVKGFFDIQQYCCCRQFIVKFKVT